MRGWALSRGKPSPEAIDGGWRVQVDEPEQIARYVFPSADESVRRLTESTSPALTPIKVCASPDAVAPRLASPWVIDRTSPMMTKPALAMADAMVAADYSVASTGAGAVLIAFAMTNAGDIAAGGRVALIEDVAVFDQIWTHEAHRRRGLASAVMQTLENAAAARSAQRAILVATDAGCALYKTLGWRVYAPYTTAIAPQA
ncbi:MAG: GNAT family N-acetyltransferase [Proteobacteria bacterium]|nr:GNAT family N-acetyltransferase [Pseudomonadota bacterium]